MIFTRDRTDQRGLRMSINLKKLEDYKKAYSFARVYGKLLFPLIIFWAVLGIGLMIANIVYNSDQDANGFRMAAIMIIMFVFPVATFLLAIPIAFNTNKKFDVLEKELLDSKMLADDILKFGEENGIDLLDVAIRARCVNELGWRGVPEAYAKDRIMPDKKE